jgi:hypothetical protein
MLPARYISSSNCHDQQEIGSVANFVTQYLQIFCFLPRRKKIRNLATTGGIMHVPIEQILIGGSLLLILSIVSSKASGRLGVPALLLFLVIGMLAGSDGIGKIYFEDVGLAQALGVVPGLVITGFIKRHVFMP